MEHKLAYQIKWAWSFSKPYREALLLYFLLELIALGLSLLFIYYSKHAIDYAIAGDTARMKHALWLAVWSILGGQGASLYASWVNDRMRSRMLVSLQQDVVDAQMHATWRVVKNWPTGDVMVRVNTDCQEVVQMIGTTAVDAMVTVFRLLSAFGFLWMMDPMLAVLILCISPLVVFSKLYFKKLRNMNQQLKRAESNLGNVVQENMRFRLVIRALGLERIRKQKVTESQKAIYAMKMRVLNFSTVSKGILRFTVNTGFLLTFVWGIFRLHAGEITFGTMSAFLQLVGRIQGPVLTLMGFVPTFIRFRTALERVDEMLQSEKEEKVAAEYLPAIQHVRLRGVGFRYEDKGVLDQFNADFVRGKPTAVVGASGKGKTTLIRLLLCLLRPDSGLLQLHTDGREIPLSSAHRTNFAYVPQGDKLFSGTIRENLQVNRLPVSEERIREVLVTSCALFVYDLPDGLDTVVGESGYGLSEGQAQRIAVARALLQDCAVWLFDEVTSALDPSTGTELTERLIKVGQDKIMIFVTHDRMLIERCSQVVYIS
ncbi:ABC transporter ATP-binding protein [Sphingobacterium corticibacterium]|uniref:ABC transporter ATP-binding protein n=1 Tax=Sphingobacterium corticibacterium TaxID=2484746 RepID=A0A4Q6XG88_9SPHI|nr:ABC transporter ATP-binding protein [Sphingobacterium corticibacterium]RZF58871.1 ABC transporter ATP-binding protein [Sphingobacterium corticibacterium]